jgi:branched-subunit amino acid aminotransferase/4-amino-4-deoxychorismate lyase
VVPTFLLEGSTTRLWAEHNSLREASQHLPDGAYSTLRTYSGNRFLRLSQHVARLSESAALQGQAGSLSEPDARASIAHALRETSFPESRLRLTWAPPRFFVSLEPFAPLPEALYRDGVGCVSVPVRRENPHAKDTRFIATASAAYQSLPPDAHEGLIVAEDGAILEGLSSNFFAVLDDTLRSEGERVLLGVTRSLVLEVAAPVLPFVARAVRQNEILRVSEAFLTSVSRGILPVTHIDDDAVGAGRPGSVTLELRARFAALEARETAPI